MTKTSEIIKLQDSEATKNSFYRAPKISPTIVHQKDHVEVRTVDMVTKVFKLEETVLGLIADFKAMPYWLIQQWFEDFNNYNCFATVAEWINTGLTWIETAPYGVFLRPTKFLLDMFNVQNQTYTGLPLNNKINHLFSEAQLVFDIQMGNEKSEMWQIIKDEETLPCYHPLNIEPSHDSGTIAIREESFSANRFNPKELLQREEQFSLEIKSGQRYTSEFSDFTKFPIVYVDENENVITQTPDVIVPVPRQNTLPKSYAIEIELSAKPAQKYKDILTHYKNNTKFGKLFYLCRIPRISQMVKDAFKDVQGLGTCELYILPFVPPAQRLQNYSAADEKNKSNLITLSIKASKEK